MCGILGYALAASSAPEQFSQWIREATPVLNHRGPDSNGLFFTKDLSCGLGHVRLAIQDLSEAGHQPMPSVCQHWQMVFNGEIYNHLDLRSELEAERLAPSWRGHSDTETLLGGFSAWGFKATLQKAVGMFAIAALHLPSKTLYLAIDRFGEKPLYYANFREQGIAFASELKALRVRNLINEKINTAALGQYLQNQYVAAPQTIFNDVYKLLPGHILEIPCTGQFHRTPQSQPYWQYADCVTHGLANPISDEQTALAQLEQTLVKTISQQCLSDVPLGSFLSGGVDSSLVTALMQAQSDRPIDTFTVGFDVKGYDESAHALAVAKHLGTNHHELRVSSADALNTIPNLASIYCEPFADSSQVPTLLVCQSAKQHATVALSGDAGDELFGGYNRYLWGQRVWSKLAPLGNTGRNSLAWMIELLSPAQWDSLSKLGNRADATGVARLGEKLHKVSSKMRNCNSLDQFYAHLISEWIRPSSLLKTKVNDEITLLELPSQIGPAPIVPIEPIAAMMYRDAMSYLPGDILTKVDRAAMSISLETRAPFLDHRVAELAWRLPMHMKVKNGVGKWALREILYKYVPQSLIERPKAGFAIPIGPWLRGELRPWAESLLCPIFKNHSEWFEPIPIQRVWNEHLSGKFDHSAKLWTILMFQAWLVEPTPTNKYYP